MPKWPVTGESAEEALRRIEKARESGARKLDLSFLKLSTLPEAIGRLSQLQRLDLSVNQLSTLPEAIGQLSLVRELYLHDNQLSRLPEALASSPNSRCSIFAPTN